MKTPGRVIASIAVAFATAVLAQPQPPQPQPQPQLRPDNPPPKLPVPVFEGQSAPLTTKKLSNVSSPSGPGRWDSIVIVNRSTAPAWITLYRDGALEDAGCTQPQGEWKISLGREGGRWLVNAEAADPKCQRKMGSKCSFERPAGVGGLELLGGAGGCRWQAMAPANLKVYPDKDPNSPQFCKYSNLWENQLVTKNTHSTAAVWVTLYAEDWLSRTIMQSGCVRPGETRPWCVSSTGKVERTTPFPELRRYTVEYKYDYTVRTEMQGATCSGRVNCDTGLRTRWNWATSNSAQGIYKTTFNANAQRCWVETASYDWPPPAPPPPPPPPPPTCPYNCQSWNPASRSCIGPQMNSCGSQPEPAQSCPYNCQTWNPASRSCIGPQMNSCGSQPEPAQSCPYTCQTWNPASRSCIGAPMNGCR